MAWEVLGRQLAEQPLRLGLGLAQQQLQLHLLILLSHLSDHCPRRLLPSPGFLGCLVTLNEELVNVSQENDLLKFTVTGGTGSLSTQAFFSLAQILLSR